MNPGLNYPALPNLGKAFKKPERLFVAILGGAKVGDKVPVIRSLMQKVDELIIGGAMMYTFHKAGGLDIGNSYFGEEAFETAKDLLRESEDAPADLLLPRDCLVADRFNTDKYDPETKTKTVDKDQIPEGWYRMDIGEDQRRLCPCHRTLEEIRKQEG